jgi:patatin-like phospholipase/acyl hydrolase
MSNKTFKILSIDGGGIRGVIPAMVLAEIEARTKQPIASLFDLIVGTSTGGILTLGLTTPIVSGQSIPKFKANDLVKIYTERGEEIFKRTFFLTSIRSFLDSTYTHKGLEKIATEKFQDTRLKEVIKPVIVTSYDIENLSTYYFNSRLAVENPGEENFLLRDIVRSTSAAPTYFEPFLYQKYTDRTPPSSTFVDGGVFANNPAMLGYVEAKIVNDQNRQKNEEEERSRDFNADELQVAPREIAESFFLLSLGTGSVKKSFTHQKTKNWGVLNWARPIVDILMQSSADSIDYQVKHLLPPNPSGVPRYIRLTPDEIKEENSDMANASAKNIAALCEYASELIKKRDREIDKAIEILLKH